MCGQGNSGAGREHADTILEWVSDGFCALDRNWLFTYVNPAWEKLTGKNRQELPGRTFWELFPEMAGTPFEREIRKAAAEREPISFENYDAGRARWFSITAYPAGEGGLAIYTRDITDRKRFEERLLASEECFRRFFELGFVGMAITSPSKGCIEVNDEICRILGYERSELLEKTWAEMTHPDDLAEDIANFQRVVDGEVDGYSLEKRWIRKDGTVIHSAISAQCVRNADGSIAYFLALLQDITARKQAEETLMLAHRELEQRVAERTAELRVANAELRRQIEERERAEMEARSLRDELAAELNALQSLHDFSTRLMHEKSMRTILEEVLNAVLALQQGDAGCVHLCDADSGVMRLVARRGNGPDWSGAYASLCGESPFRPEESRVRVIVEDILTDARVASWRAEASLSGFRSVQFTPLFGREGESLGLLTTCLRQPHLPSARELRFMDLYARHAAEAIERKRNEDLQSKLAALVENSKDFIGMASLDGQAQIVNSAGRRLVGIDTAGKVRTTRVPEYFVEEERERLEKEILPIALGEGWWEGETRFRHFATGAVIPMLQSIFPIRDPGSGRPFALGTIAHDLRQRRRAQEALREAQAQLAHMARVNTAGELVATIAHEMNQPLTAIVTNGDAMLRWLNQSPPDLREVRRALEAIVRQGLRASEVITRIRALLRTNTETVPNLDVNRLIEEVLSMIHDELEAHDIHVRTELSSDLPAVPGDPVQIQQVILNLLLNAIDAIRSRSDSTRDLLLTSRANGRAEVIVSVEDSGIGIAPESMPRLFHPFFSTKREGIGMGLSISRSIIEAHGGRLWAASSPALGAIFQFLLPVRSGD